jgi:hypothetical protein
LRRPRKFSFGWKCSFQLLAISFQLFSGASDELRSLEKKLKADG